MNDTVDTRKNDLLEAKRYQRDVIKAWMEVLLARTGWSPSHLANKAGIAASTVLRLIHNNTTFVPTFSTLTKISSASGYRIDQAVLESFGVNEKGIDARMTMPDIPAKTRDDSWSAKPRDDNRMETKPDIIQPAKVSLAQVDDVKAPSRRRNVEQIRVQFVSSLPKALQPMTRPEVFVDRPAKLDGDPTAFAFFMPDSAFEPLLMKGMLMFGSKLRDPRSGDLVLMTKKDGRSMVRLVVDVSEDGISVATGIELSDAGTVRFDEITDYGVVSVMERS